jgi:hypothetical protein
VCVTSPHDRCPPGTRLWSLSEVNLDLPPGSVPECFKVAVGTTPGLENVAKIGIDVLVEYMVCLSPGSFLSNSCETHFAIRRQHS